MLGLPGLRINVLSRLRSRFQNAPGAWPELLDRPRRAEILPELWLPARPPEIKNPVLKRTGAVDAEASTGCAGKLGLTFRCVNQSALDALRGSLAVKTGHEGATQGGATRGAASRTPRPPYLAKLRSDPELGQKNY